MHILFADLWLLGFLLLGGTGAIFISEMGTLLGLIILSFFTTVGLYFMFDVNLFSIFYNDPKLLVIFSVGYLLTGAAYVGFWRWPDWLKKQIDVIDKDYAEHCRRNSVERNEASLEEFMESGAYIGVWSPGYNKELITVWLLLWPFALFWELSHRPATWLWNNVYRFTGSFIENMGKAAVRRNLKMK